MTPDRSAGLLPRHWLQVALVAAVYVALATRLFLLISRYAVNIFFSDQWDFNVATLFEKHTVWQMFAWQQGPEHQGLGALLTRLIEPHFRWNSRVDSFLVGIIVAVAALCALWLKKRLYGELTVSDALIPIIFFTPAQFETLFVTANWSHGPLPLLLILLFCLSWTCRNVLARYSLISALNFLTIFTGFGLFLGCLTPLLLAADYWVNLNGTPKGKTYFLSALFLALASLGAFFIDFKFELSAACFPGRVPSPHRYVGFVAFMLADFFGVKGMGWFPRIAGAMLLFVLLTGLAVSTRRALKGSRSDWARSALTATLISYCLLFCANTAWGRMCFGLDKAQASRYMIYLELGMLGLYFFFLGLGGHNLRRTAVGLFAICLATTLRINPSDHRSMVSFREVKESWRACYLKTSDVNECDRVSGLWIYPPWGGQQPALKEKLNYLQKTRQNLYSDSP